VQPSAGPAAPVTSVDTFDPFNINPMVNASTPSAPPTSVINFGIQTNGSNTNQGSHAFASSSSNASFDPFGPIPLNTNAQPASNLPVMNSFNNGGIMNNTMMNGGTMNTSVMNGMNHPMMYQNQIQQGMFGGIPSHNMTMMNSNTMAMMNGMNNSNMMMNGTNNSSNMMMNGMNNNSNNITMNGNFAGKQHMMMGNNGPMGMMMPSSGGSAMSATPQPVMAMNMNIMQPMNNSISNNFGSKPAATESSKKDPYAGLGF
jgi:hypothetical protein